MEPKKMKLQCVTEDRSVDLSVEVDVQRIQIVLLLLINCKYTNKGCFIKDYVRDIKKHEEICFYCLIKCPFETKENICPEMTTLILHEHIKEHHTSAVIIAKENFIDLPITLNEENTESRRIIRLIQVHNELILFCTRVCIYTLQTSLFYVRRTTDYLTCDVTLMTDGVVTSKKRVPILCLASFPSTFLNVSSGTFDIKDKPRKGVKDIIKDISLRIAFNITGTVAELDETDALNKLICNYCCDFVSTTYYECENNHYCCNTCYEAVGRCGTSNDPESPCSGTKFNFDSSNCRCGTILKFGTCFCNNVLKEGNVDVVKSLMHKHYPCKFKEFGCQQQITKCTRTHELSCPFKKIDCVFSVELCRFSGQYVDFPSHLNESHPDNTVLGNTVKLTQFEGTAVYFIVFDAVFLCQYKSRIWSIESIVTPVIYSDFSFELTFTSSNRQLQLTLITSTDCKNQVYVPRAYYSIYNSRQNTAYFRLHETYIHGVEDVSIKISKKA